MSVICKSKEDLEEVFNHLNYIIIQEDEFSEKIIKSIKENYKSHIEYLKKYHQYDDKTCLKSCIFNFLSTYKKVNTCEYCLKYSQEDIIIKKLTIDDLENFNNVEEKQKSLFNANCNLNSLLYNIGEYVNLPNNDQQFLEEISEIYSKNEEVKEKQNELKAQYNRHI